MSTGILHHTAKILYGHGKEGKFILLKSVSFSVIFTAAFYFLFFLVSSFIEDATLFKLLIVSALALAFGLGGMFIRISDVEPTIRNVVRFFSFLLLFYLIVERPDFTLVHEDGQSLIVFVNVSYFLALALALLSAWRPSFLLYVSLYLVMTRAAADEISGYILSTLDIRSMMQMAGFYSVVAVTSVGAFGLNRLGDGWKNVKPYIPANLLFAGFAIHFQFYFWSGIGKLTLDPYPWTWIFENPTEVHILGGLMNGLTPVATFPAVAQAIYDLYEQTAVFGNIAVVIVQCGAIFAVLRLFLMRFLVVVYDIFHVMLYLTFGLFFWPWLFNNAAVLVGLHGKTEKDVGLAPRLTFVFVVLLGLFPFLGNASRLAWFDYTEIKHSRLEVQLRDGETWIKVPVSFFMSHSYAISHAYYARAAEEGHYPPREGGGGVERARLAGSCPPIQPLNRYEAAEDRAARLHVLESFVRAHHAKMIQRAETFGHINFYFRSHHHPSNPLVYEEFNAIDLRDVVRYRVLTRSICPALVDAVYTETILAESSHEFDVE